MTNPTVNPSEVGWQFVPQYYTFVNKQPHRLHCFYTKASTFIHGTEGEDGKPCYGQQVRLLPAQDASYFQMFAFLPALLLRVAAFCHRITFYYCPVRSYEPCLLRVSSAYFGWDLHVREQKLIFPTPQEIHAKITSIGFQDCKVFIHSVDAQSSANGGIIIQVIGEMSNRGEPWRKFVQTFFLAEQPNGYFVLNDIFRFLKEETVEDEPSEDAEVAVPDVPAVQEAAPPSEPATPAPVSAPVVEPTPEPSPAPAPTPLVPVEEPEEPPVPEEVPEQQTNGVHEPAEEPAPAPAAESPSQPAPEPLATASPPPVSPVPAHSSLAPSPAPPAQPSPAQAPAAHVPAPAPAAPTPTAPPAPKTWANLAASGRNKWGSAVAQDVRGVSEAPVASSSPAPATPAPQSPAPHPRPQGQSPAAAAAASILTPLCFVKVISTPYLLLKLSLTFARRVSSRPFPPMRFATR